jgi:arginine utilization protein RocB
MKNPGHAVTKPTSAWFDRVRQLTLDLVAKSSVTGTEGEASFAEHLHGLLASHPYFRENPAQLRLLPVPGKIERQALVALVRYGHQAVILSGHFDTVSLTNYRDLAPWACQPEALQPRLIRALERVAGGGAGLARADLMSGEFMPGRGALDMKSGLAAGIAVLERFAHAGADGGSLLLLATPDEEETSAGIRAVMTALPSLLRGWDLQAVGAINLDATSDQGQAGEGRSVFLGSVGKLLPFAYVVGSEAHAGTPFAGINASFLAAEIARRVEWNPQLADEAEGEVAPAPVTLKLADSKRGYDVTTPPAVWCYFNQLTHGSSAAQVLDRLVCLAGEALQESIRELELRAKQHRARSGELPASWHWETQLLTYAQLRERAGPLAMAAEQAADPAADLPEQSHQVTEALWKASGLSGPAAVIGFAGIAYPPVLVRDQPGPHRRMREIVARETAALGEETGELIGLRSFYPAISDMSFLASAAGSWDQAVLIANTPHLKGGIEADGAAVAALDLPVINIGPWGRGAHEWLERVHMPYAFDTVPELIWRVVTELLAVPGDGSGLAEDRSRRG